MELVALDESLAQHLLGQYCRARSVELAASTSLSYSVCLERPSSQLSHFLAFHLVWLGRFVRNPTYEDELKLQDKWHLSEEILKDWGFVSTIKLISRWISAFLETSMSPCLTDGISRREGWCESTFREKGVFGIACIQEISGRSKLI